MITETYSLYQLNPNQFHNLFTENVKDETLDVLSNSASNGNLDAIDVLHNLSLRHDDAGKKAENILFELFSGGGKGRCGIDRDIQLTSLKLYEMILSNRQINNTDFSKFYFPSRLLYMAGSAATSVTQRHDISSFFRGRQETQSHFEQIDDSDLWRNDRMLTTDEINASVNIRAENYEDLSLNFPIGLIEPFGNANLLSEQIYEKILSVDFLRKPEVFPVNTGGHWVLMVLYKDRPENDTKAIVFNTLNSLSADVGCMLSDSAKIAGVSDGKGIKFIDGNIQEYVKNGCGLFVIKVIDSIHHAHGGGLVNIMKGFVSEFQALSIEEKILFNIQSRRQLHGDFILSINMNNSRQAR